MTAWMMKGRAERLRLLHERGRLGRGMRHGGVRYWIGHHRQLGLLIFDPHAQREVETGKVRLFSVPEHESRLFMLNMARTRPLWSSPDDHLEEMRRAVIEYGRARERQRETHCYWCRRDINSVDFSLCTRCGWIRCACGYCGCDYRGQRAAGGDQDRGGSASRSARSARRRFAPGSTIPVVWSTESTRVGAVFRWKTHPVHASPSTSTRPGRPWGRGRPSAIFCSLRTLTWSWKTATMTTASGSRV